MTIEHVVMSGTAGGNNVCWHKQIFWLLPSLNNLFSPETLGRERPAYRDKMNNVRFLCIGEGVAAVVYACDVIIRSLMGGPWDHPTLSAGAMVPSNGHVNMS